MDAQDRHTLVRRIADELATLDIGDISRDELETIVAAEVDRAASSQSVAGSGEQNVSEVVPASGTGRSEARLESAPEPRIAHGARRPWLIAGGATVVVIAALAAALLAVSPPRSESAADPALRSPGPSSAVQPTALPVAKPAFAPTLRFTGNTTSVPYAIAAGAVDVKGGQLTVEIGQLEGMDGAYDYISLKDTAGTVFKFEAEDASVTTGDAYASSDQVDGHWWLQAYAGFSGGKALIVRKTEVVPVLKTTVQVPDGKYELHIGSFTGDQTFGVFGLGLTVK